MRWFGFGATSHTVVQCQTNVIYRRCPVILRVDIGVLATPAFNVPSTQSPSVFIAAEPVRRRDLLLSPSSFTLRMTLSHSPPSLFTDCLSAVNFLLLLRDLIFDMVKPSNFVFWSTRPNVSNRNGQIIMLFICLRYNKLAPEDASSETFGNFRIRNVAPWSHVVTTGTFSTWHLKGRACHFVKWPTRSFKQVRPFNVKRIIWVKVHLLFRVHARELATLSPMQAIHTYLTPMQSLNSTCFCNISVKQPVEFTYCLSTILIIGGLRVVSLKRKYLSSRPFLCRFLITRKAGISCFASYLPEGFASLRPLRSRGWSSLAVEKMLFCHHSDDEDRTTIHHPSVRVSGFQQSNTVYLSLQR